MMKQMCNYFILNKNYIRSQSMIVNDLNNFKKYKKKPVNYEMTWSNVFFSY